MELGIKEKLERWKLLAEAYLLEDKDVFIKDLDDNWYFAKVIISGETRITIDCYAPQQRVGRYYLPWAKITFFDEKRVEN
jgi:hypothetical protein